MRFIESLKLAGLLSFPPDMEPFELDSLNVLIGPNGSGKSNFIEAFELLRALPTDFAMAASRAGGVRELIWKGEGGGLFESASIGLTTRKPPGGLLERPPAMDYLIEFSSEMDRVKIIRENISKSGSTEYDGDSVFYYRRELGRPTIILEQEFGLGSSTEGSHREVESSDISDNQSVLAQFRDPKKYRQMFWLERNLSLIQTFREWSFGPRSEARKPQRTDLPGDRLLPDAGNLAVIVNNLDSWGRRGEFNDLLKRFFPRVERLSTPVIGGTVQLLLHETGFDTPVPAARMSDGTLRFVAMLAVLLSPEPPPLVCIEEPELGLHPDAVMLMGDVLKEASERMQLVVTTHSNALVSAFDDRANAIVTCERPGAGTVLRRLDPDALADLLETYSLGHLWRQGELGANP